MEGKNFTLEWNYTLNGTVFFTKFAIANDDGSDLNIGMSFGPGAVPVQAQFQPRFKPQVTDTRAQLSILAVQTSDEGAYRLAVFPTGAGTMIWEEVILVVNCEY